MLYYNENPGNEILRVKENLLSRQLVTLISQTPTFMVVFVIKWFHFDTNSMKANLENIFKKNESVHLLSLVSPATF